MKQSRQRCAGFSAAELLVAMAIGAVIIGAAAVAYGTIARSQPRVGSSAVVTLDSTRLRNYYNLNQGTIQATVAPNYGSLARAEDMRERFLNDCLSATAVFPLARTGINAYRPFQIAFDPATDTFPDNPLRFRELLVTKGLVAASVFLSTRNYNATASNASIFILGYSPDAGKINVTAIYEIDVSKTTSPPGFYASVRRHANSGSGSTLTAYYDVFYPPSDLAAWTSTTDSFAPLWVSFERQARRDLSPPETTDIERFKLAREKPFYFIWWPDPAAKSLGQYRASNTSYRPTEARQAYNHMAARTSFMFTVPVFPAL